jgi:hypothetical protein
MRPIFTLAALLLLAGCATTPIQLSDQSRNEEFDEPAIGEVTSRAVGETMVTKGKRTVGPALQVFRETQFNKAEGEKSIMTCAVTAMPGVYFKRGTYTKDPVGADCFGPVSFRITNADGSTNWNCPGQMAIADICNSGETYFIAYLAQRIFLKQDFDNLKRVEKTLEGRPNFVQELVYNGRAGSTIRLLYREFAEDAIRPAFSQDLQYDLDESTTVGFRDLRLEILDANNTEIRFRLDKGF